MARGHGSPRRSAIRRTEWSSRPTSTRRLLETALLPAPFWCTKRVEPAHFDWHWRERPALALLAWEACSRSVDEATPHPRGVNWKRQLILVWQIVGEPEADAKKRKISIFSPLARALIA